MKTAVIVALLASTHLRHRHLSTPPTLTATHYWDCNGASCDSRTLQPWNERKYVYASAYAPIDPNDHGGAVYGETIWLTGAASDALSALLQPDDGCCGTDPDGGGGCGKCVLVTNPTAVESTWKALVMKKNRCPPWSNGCESGKVHLDIAVPAFDNLQFSTANVCGSALRDTTTLTRAQSSTCGSWYTQSDSTLTGCDCGSLPVGAMRDGCERFRRWGWTSGDPQLTYEVVDCPSAFVDIVGGAFDAGGVVDEVVADDDAATPVATPTMRPTPAPPAPTPSTTTPPATDWYCNWNGCNGVAEGGDWCNAARERCKDGCGGRVCSRLPTPAPPPRTWYCNWNGCNGVTEGGDWCNAARARCEDGCGGRVCEG